VIFNNKVRFNEKEQKLRLSCYCACREGMRRCRHVRPQSLKFGIRRETGFSFKPQPFYHREKHSRYSTYRTVGEPRVGLVP